MDLIPASRVIPRVVPGSGVIPGKTEWMPGAG